MCKATLNVFYGQRIWTGVFAPCIVQLHPSDKLIQISPSSALSLLSLLISRYLGDSGTMGNNNSWSAAGSITRPIMHQSIFKHHNNHDNYV